MGVSAGKLKRAVNEEERPLLIGIEEDPPSTTLYDLPMEMLDVILQKSYLHWILNTSTKQRDEDVIRSLISVDVCFYRRITRQRFNKAIWRYLRDFYEKAMRRSAIIRNNRNYLLKTIQPNNEFISSLLFLNCVTEEQCYFIQRQNFIRDKNAEIFEIMRTLNETKFLNFVKCLQQNDQSEVARIVSKGGVAVKVTFINCGGKIAETVFTQLIHQRMNDLLNMINLKSGETNKCVRLLRNKDIETLNSQRNKHTVVVWIWCRTQTALEHIQIMYESNQMREVFFDRIQPSTSMVFNIERNQFKKNAGFYQMKMENEVSTFLVSTCRMKTPFSLPDDIWIPITGTRYSGISGTLIPCGSQAEFYIQPILSCIDDLDLLESINCLFAFDSNCEIPEGVGNLFDVIHCYRLGSYEQNKSFVRLRSAIVGEYDWKTEEYIFVNMPVTSLMNRDYGLSMSPNNILRFSKHNTMFSYINGELIEENSENFFSTIIGPAFKQIEPISNKKTDVAVSIFCPNWPLVAEEWPKRRRLNGWPNSETINKVVRDGCDVVSAIHRDMQDDLNQWRLSFSRAEVTLIQSWNPTQQIVYHLLRFFAKREITRKNCPKKEEVVCTYHLKTLMLWSCEEESTEWWDTLSVIAICCNLCGKLCECLKHKRCPNYFIPEANLLDHELDSQVLQQTVRSLDHYQDVNKLSQWFATHYILPVYKILCNEDETFLTKEKIETCLMSVCDYNEKRKLKRLDRSIVMCAYICFCFCLNHSHVSVCPILNYFHGLVKASDSDLFIKSFLDTSVVSKALSDYFKALVLFHMSQSILNDKLQCDVETLSEIWIHTIRKSYFVENSISDKSMVYFNHAEQMMKHLSYGYSKTESYFATMVSMLCLQQSLCRHDTSSYITQTASRIYLAALYYYIGHYQQCTTHLCSAVATSFKERDPCRDVRNLKVNSLLFMDDLATIAGFLLLRRKILQTPSKEVSFISPNLFAHFLLFLCNPNRLEIKEVPQIALSFEADCCLAAMIRYRTLRRIHADKKTTETLIYSRQTEDTEESTTEIVFPGTRDVADALGRISNDYMTRFYTSLSEEFGTKFNLGSCYEALSLYLFRRYEDVLFMCEKLLEEPGDDSELEEFQYLNVNVCTYFMAYFDEDIQTLVGFQLLAIRLSSIQHRFFDYFLRHNIEGSTRMTTNDHKLHFLFANTLFCDTFRPILRKQFLGNYLKLRCLLDLECPMFEVISAFQCLESRFPFENSLVHFMHRKVMRKKLTDIVVQKLQK